MQNTTKNTRRVFVLDGADVYKSVNEEVTSAESSSASSSASTCCGPAQPIAEESSGCCSPKSEPAVEQKSERCCG